MEHFVDIFGILAFLVAFAVRIFPYAGLFVAGFIVGVAHMSRTPESPSRN